MENARVVRERLFNDNLADRTAEAIRYYDESVFLLTCCYPKLFNVLGDNLSGKVICDYGCGVGYLSIPLLRRGANVFGFDVSPNTLVNARAMIQKHTSRNAQLDCYTAESLGYPEDFFDCVVGNAILHHLDLGAALPELRRVLKTGAWAHFFEPIGTNPVVEFARNHLPYPYKHRSADERPLTNADFSLIRRNFSEVRVQYCELTLMLVRLNPWAAPWQKTPPVMLFERPIRSLLERVDGAILRAAPRLGRWCRMAFLSLRK